MSIDTKEHDSSHLATRASEHPLHGEWPAGPIVAAIGPPLLPALFFGLDAVITVVGILFAVGGGIAILVLTVAVEYERRNMEATIEVTDDGVDVDVSGPLSLRSWQVFIPFEDVRRVEYTDSYRQVQYAHSNDKANPSNWADSDSRLKTSRMYNLGVDEGKLQRGTVAGCVRVELEGEWPVYVGAARYEELAATIAANAPHVEEATECDYEPTLMP